MQFPAKHRLVVISNRLPFTARQENGQLIYEESPGGVAAGLRTCLAALRSHEAGDYLWIGWPGSQIGDALADNLRATAAEKFCALPVLLSGEEMDHFYNGFCNRALWPLFHYFTSHADFREEEWESYRHVNGVFSDAVHDAQRPGDILWIHDYHLMLLPGLLRDRTPGATIGFFLHIPFPSYEVFRLLPQQWRKDILEGLLGADLVGFHTYGDMQNFLQAVHRIFGYDNHMGQIETSGRIVKVASYPMGIDFARFAEAEGDPCVRKETEALRASLPAMRTVLSIDRLDYTKGIVNRLAGFERLLEENTALHGKVVLLMVVVPSRIGVDQYEQMKRQIEELVGNINGRFGTIGWTPILYRYRSLTFAPLAALYAVSDVALVTPLRDGMNLIAKEYIASRWDGSGVLILSEMAGAAKELGEALIVNPHHAFDIARALEQALAMPEGEQKRRNSIMRNRLRRYDVVRWGSEFLAGLEAAKQIQARWEARLLPGSARAEILENYRTAQRPLILLDYDGTLVPFALRPEGATPGRDLLRLLRLLADGPGTSVVIVSGRDRHTLQGWVGDTGVHLVAEHGAWVRESGGAWSALGQQTSGWKHKILPILESYADRLPGAFVEEKEFSAAWHFRGAHPEQGAQLSSELTDHLVTFTANLDLQVLPGRRVVEVRNAGLTKGMAGRHWVGLVEPDFVLAIGDDRTDEDLFVALPDDAYTVKVGRENSHAHFNVRNPEEVLQLLAQMAAARTPGEGGTTMSAGGRSIPMSRRKSKAAFALAMGLTILPLAARIIARASSYSWFRPPER
jgi:trehalose 6-phosphate synthase/phosphatase